MTTPPSSIVVVDKSGSADANNLIQSSTSQHHLYHHPQAHHDLRHHQIHAQQVIVNEEYISADSIVTAGNINYLKTNDLLNNAQIIQFVSDEQATLIEQRQGCQATTTATVVGNQSQDDLYSTMLPQTIANPNSKVQVISNVTLVSKAQQPQTINFVNSGKYVQGQVAGHTPKAHQQTGNAVAVAAAPIAPPNYVNTYISSKTATVGGKIVNIPYKTATLQATQQPSQTNQPTAHAIQQQPTHQHIITKHLNNSNAIVQKMPIQRNVHLLSSGRIQTQQPTQHALQNRHLGDDAMTIAAAHGVRVSQQQQTAAGVIQIQAKTNFLQKSNVNVATVKTSKKHQTVKLFNQSGAAVAAAAAASAAIPTSPHPQITNQSYTIQPQHVPVNHQIKSKPAQQRVYLTSNYNNEYQYQHGAHQATEHANKNGPEYFRVK